MTTINLLPWRERRRRRRRRAFVGGIAVALLGGVGVVAAAGVLFDERIAQARQDNARSTERLGTLDSELAGLADLGERTADLETRVGAIRRLHAERLATVRVFDELARTLPPGLRYTALARRGRVLSVQGVADAQSSVSALMRNVERSPWFAQPSLQNIADAEADGTHAVFHLTFETVVAATAGADAAAGGGR